MANWIKPTEKLPEPTQRLLVTIEDPTGKPMVLPCIVLDDKNIRIGEEPIMRTFSLDIVKAWMPFPQPYQETQHGVST